MQKTVLPFNGGEKFTPWYNRFCYFADLLQVKAEERKAAFLACVGTSIFGLLSDVGLRDASLEEIATFLSETYDDRIVGKHAQSDFLNRRQFESESIRQYAISLKKLYETGYTVKAEQFIISQFINGLLDSAIQRETFGHASGPQKRHFWTTGASKSRIKHAWLLDRPKRKKGCP
ncbi:hypothetical protein RF11_01275 [Thelohanellus kitauei]|uniref:Retrotransposon gag domain-containing protein n=1 Tax=Thelohanellus kitauei TaxID=669202 RepID=A0A0C2MU27_THEKT|nr:hypothetical protein RF11_01275 [Thelohanellus kitauei]